jgi:multidrug efflux pump subunit AcrA (membrane-fusion protein)
VVSKALPVLLSLVVLAATAACNRSQAQPPPTGAKLRPIAVTTARAEARAVQRAVETSGSLTAWDEVVAKSEQQGTIARLRVDLGDRVAAGAVLAEYDRREFQLAVDQTQADLNATRELLARAHANTTATEAQLRRVRDTLTTLEADLARTGP